MEDIDMSLVTLVKRKLLMTIKMKIMKLGQFV